MLFPELKNHDELRKVLRTDFNDYPLTLGMVNRLLRAGHSPQLALLQLNTTLRRKMRKYADELYKESPRSFEIASYSFHQFIRTDHPVSDDEIPEFDRNFVYEHLNRITAKATLRAIFPDVLAWGDKLFKLTPQTLMLLTDPVAYERSFWVAARGSLLVPVGVPPYSKAVSTAFLPRSVLRTMLEDFTSKRVGVFSLGNRAQGADFISLQISVTGKKCALFFYQLTLNSEHSSMADECRKPQTFLGGRSILERCIDDVCEYFKLPVAAVYFVYITSQQRLQITTARGTEVTIPDQTWTKIADSKPNTQLSILDERIRGTGRIRGPDNTTTNLNNNNNNNNQQHQLPSAAPQQQMSGGGDTAAAASAPSVDTYDVIFTDTSLDRMRRLALADSQRVWN